MKEKIWIEKLVELLNEYRTEKGERNLNEFEVSQTLDSLNYMRLFIKWLVDNEKLNIRKLDYRVSSVDIPVRYYLWTFIRYSFEKEILMAFAIKDEPIEFLISLLKNV